MPTHAIDWNEEAAILYKIAFRATKCVGSLPYNWNVRKREVEYSKSLARSFIYVAQFLLYSMYEGFAIYRWIYFSFDENASTQEKAGLQYVATAYMLPVILHTVVLWNRGNLHNFINRLLIYVRDDFKRLPDDGRKLLNIGGFIRSIPYMGTAVICLNMVTLFRRPMSPHLLTSLLPDVANRKKWELIPFALIHGYIWCNMWSMILFFCTLLISCNSATLNALNRTRPHSQMYPERFYRETRKLELLQGNYNALFRWGWWACEIVLVTIFVFGICGSIWTEGTLSARLFCVSIFVLGGTLKLWKGLGEVFETASEVNQEWRERDAQPSVLFRKRIKSMRPIRVQIGGYFYVDAAMSLTLLSIISENTFNVLLAA